jgi:class 3 adenylate cyclase
VRLAGERDDISFRSLGEVPLKGMASPVEVYEALLHSMRSDAMS